MYCKNHRRAFLQMHYQCWWNICSKSKHRTWKCSEMFWGGNKTKGYFVWKRIRVVKNKKKSAKFQVCGNYFKWKWRKWVHHITEINKMDLCLQIFSGLVQILLFKTVISPIMSVRLFRHTPCWKTNIAKCAELFCTHNIIKWIL